MRSTRNEFAAFVEEIDHLLLLAERAGTARPLSRFEMELHANVSKYLVLARFLAGRTPRIEARRRAWLRYHLFDKGFYCDDDPGVRSRYRDAARWAGRFLDHLGRFRPAERIRMLREFHRAGADGKLRLIRMSGNARCLPGQELLIRTPRGQLARGAAAAAGQERLATP